ncbi:outer membrane beta-barrel family protein [Flavobacteriaceae bacterium S356]|uniref:Outer membrane beta-barrel family protein n=1 Tax=Asprobacillus argus TaxID=3076534 RepID=A0ABU3LGJ1_9FLAO|nr:outer membrane beta-barrel family protein [Flavobacteriaceae bacterium S356]
MKTISTILFLLVSTICLGQITIKAKVIDKDQKPVSFANVVLLDSKTKSIYRGEITNEEGLFVLTNVKAGTYKLRVTFLGYKDHIQTFELTESIMLEPILLIEDTEALDEIQITAKKPTVKRKIDRLVFNVENTSLSIGNAWDVLKKTPGVLVNNEQLTIRNSANILILINDKRVYLSASELKNLLEGTSAQEITSVEVITNPPAKYEAEGNAILNIRMKKNLVTGYKGTVGGNFTQARYAKQSVTTSHYFKNKKVNLYGSYTHTRGRYNRLEEELIDFNTAATFRSFLNRNSWSRTHNIRVNSEFYLNEKSNVTVGTQLYYRPNWKAKNSTDSRVLNPDNSLASTFITNSNANDFIRDLGVDVDYELKFTDTQKMQISMHYTTYDGNGDQQVETNYFDLLNVNTGNNRFATNRDQETTIYNAQLDYENTISEDTKFETGFKFATVSSLSDLKHFNFINGQNVLDPTKTNAFSYNETNVSAYISYQTAFEKWSFKGGLRGEYTDLTGESITINQTNKSNYFKVFPTIYVQYSPNDNHQFGVTYGKRISRPNYSSLNPFRFYFSDYSFFEGNPGLRPTISHNFELQYTLFKSYNIELYYGEKVDYITEVNYQNNQDNSLRFSTVNVPSKKGFGVNFSTNFTFNNRWSLYTEHSVYNDENSIVAQENNNQLITNNLWGYYGYYSMSYQFLKDKSLSAEMNFFMVTDGIQGSLQIEGSEDLSLGIVKKILDNKASISLRVSDVLRSQIVRITTNYLDQNNYFIDNRETQYIRIGFKYNFGNQSLKKKKTKARSSEKNRL